MAMGMERTFSIVKPDAVARNLIGEIYSRFEKGGLRSWLKKCFNSAKNRQLASMQNTMDGLSLRIVCLHALGSCHGAGARG